MDKNEKELLDTAKKVVKVLEKKRQIETEQKLLDLAEQMVAIYREWNPDGTNFQMSWYKDIGDRPSITVENHWADDDKYKMPMQASSGYRSTACCGTSMANRVMAPAGGMNISVR